MTDATILISTFRHAALIPYSVRSALDQEDVTVEVFVVGDGVEDDARAALEPFAGDNRVRFFDFPKGERHGELNRHEALREASGRIVCYLSDDDLLLPDHAAEMSLLLEVADFAHSISARLDVDGTLEYFLWNLSRPEFVEVGLGRKASIGLTGVAHTLAAYRRLPFGWRTTPDGGPTDHHMWRQWLEQPGFRGAMGERLTYLTFPEPWWGKLPPEERRASLEGWFRRSREPGFAESSTRCWRRRFVGQLRTTTCGHAASSSRCRPSGRRVAGACVSGLSALRRCERCSPGVAGQAERAEPPVTAGDQRLRAGPGDLERGVVPAASELIRRVPLVADRVEVQGGLVEVEAVRDSRRDREPGWCVSVELDNRSHALGLGAFAEIVESDCRPPDDDRQVVSVLPVRVYPAQDVGLGANRVPLHGLDREVPGVAEELDEDAAGIGVRLQGIQLDA